MMMVVMGGALCVCVVCAAGLWWANSQGLLGFGGGISQSAGEWVCPDLPDGEDEDFEIKVKDNGVRWCEHPKATRLNADQKRGLNPVILNFSAASKLPKEAIAGKRYAYNTIVKSDGGGGVYGPNKTGGFGAAEWHKEYLKYTAP